MQDDPGREWLRLTRLYAEKTDDELLELAADFRNLTEIAQGVLRDELKKRALKEPAKASGEASCKASAEASRGGSGKAIGRRVSSERFGAWSGSSGLDDRDGERGETGNGDVKSAEYTWKTLLCTCDTREEAWQISEVLKRAGIDGWIEAPSQGSLDPSGPRVIVAADQLEEARAVMARPIPQDVIDESREKVDDFVPPRCPKCGAGDPLLESMEPVNTWRCENCGARWSDAAAVENEVQNPA